MANKNIPEVGEIFKGYIPGVRKIAHVSFGVASANPDVDVAEIAEYVLIDVTVPVVIFALWTQVEEAFTTSVTATIGDSGSLTRHIIDTTINMAATGAILVSATGLTIPYVDLVGLDIKLDLGGATVAAGLAHVYVEYSELHD